MATNSRKPAEKLKDADPQAGRLIGALLRVPHLAVAARIHEGLGQSGFDDIRPAHLVVFQHIDEKTGSRLTELADKAQMTKQSMGYLVDYLEERGYLERAPDPEDGRARIVRLTRRGELVMREARRIVKALEKEWAQLLGRKRMDQLRRTLKDLVTILEG